VLMKAVLSFTIASVVASKCGVLSEASYQKLTCFSDLIQITERSNMIYELIVKLLSYIKDTPSSVYMPPSSCTPAMPFNSHQEPEKSMRGQG